MDLGFKETINIAGLEFKVDSYGVTPSSTTNTVDDREHIVEYYAHAVYVCHMDLKQTVIPMAFEVEAEAGSMQGAVELLNRRLKEMDEQYRKPTS